jgi:hypothetical protein
MNVNSFEQIKKINEIINSIKICDPAVGSGHFLVSALNRIIALKRELGVLLKYDETPFREYDIAVIDDVLCVFDGQGREFKYNPKDSFSQSIQKTLFWEKRKIIEGCLFGVDINPNAVAICQLRLWIELLKNAYYEKGVMETLPNIDINIKCGNSLIHKIQFQVGQSIGKKDSGFSKRELELIKKYKETVGRYHSASDKREKHELKNIVSGIKENLHAACQQIVMRAKGSILYLTQESNYALDIYKDAFEWAIEFPEIISEKGCFLGFDCIIGNPPYIRIQEMNHADIDYYKSNYSTAWKRIDISTMFIELSYKLLSQNGNASYITSNQFMTTEYGRQIRQFILKNKYANKIIDFMDLPVFDGALTYVSIFFFKKNCLNKGTEYFKVPKLPFIVPNKEQITFVDYQMLDDDIWNLEAIKYASIFMAIEKNAPDLITKYAKPSYGLVTGKDEVLMFDISKEEEIETEMLLPVIRAQGCTRYGKAYPSKKVIYPYQMIGEDTEIISKSELKKNYPKTWDYLSAFESDLKERKDSRSTYADRDDWYGLIRFGQLTTFQKCKIVTPGEVKHNKFCLDFTHSGFTGARVFAISMISDEMDIRYLLGILNSKIIEFYLHHVASRKAGGYYSYSTSVLERIPLAVAQDQKPYVDLVEEIMQLTEENQDTEKLEEELDKMIYELYGICEEERNLIEQDLSGY